MPKEFNIEDHKSLKNNPFVVPEDYFTGLPAMIRFKKSLPETDGFAVPKGYFEGLSQHIQGRLALDEAGNENPFLVPPAYFEELPEQIKATIAVEQLNRLKDDPHGMPKGYFDNLADRIKQRIREEEGEADVKVVRISRTRVYWSVAAGMALMIGLGSLLFYLKDSAATSSKDILLSEYSKSLVIENPEQYNIDEQALLDEMGVDMSETQENSAEEILLESGSEISSEIQETE